MTTIEITEAVELAIEAGDLCDVRDAYATVSDARVENISAGSLARRGSRRFVAMSERANVLRGLSARCVRRIGELEDHEAAVDRTIDMMVAEVLAKTA